MHEAMAPKRHFFFYPFSCKSTKGRPRQSERRSSPPRFNGRRRSPCPGQRTSTYTTTSELQYEADGYTSTYSTDHDERKLITEPPASAIAETSSKPSEVEDPVLVSETKTKPRLVQYRTYRLENGSIPPTKGPLRELQMMDDPTIGRETTSVPPSSLELPDFLSWSPNRSDNHFPTNIRILPSGPLRNPGHPSHPVVGKRVPRGARLNFGVRLLELDQRKYAVDLAAAC
ncbi:hypothetical protein BJ875DRAFT_443743 [Amylocarpus encephaloides]|uniref:Uncharacterized protein n=1 Tax=Amylocarpus encephaloides TaxID=45428 RepID=A0A9P7YEW0_9HELO|nr:hypothetical protein BJ875DRAFT_443743 [Amylocarpus encephaloides]